MFLRRSTVTRGEKTYEYVQLVESFRRESDGMPQHRVVANLGTLSSLEFDNFKATLVASRKGRRVVVAPARSSRPVAPKPQANLRYLDLAVASELWREWGLAQLFQDIMPAGDSRVAASKVVEVLALQRLVAPNSKLAAVRWFPHTALPELLGIEPRQLNNTRIHRVLDELEATTPTLMAKLPPLYRKRDGAFASLFMDVTDAWFVGHGPNLAVRSKTKEGLVERKIGIVLLCNERGYPLRWEVIAGNCHDSGAMTEMLQAVSGLAWVGDAPVVLDRAMGHTAHLRAMAATQLRFLTALTRTEFSTYATKLPWTATEGLSVADADRSKVAAEATRRVEAAGMQKVDDTLLVLDLGVVEVGADADELACTEPSTPPQSEEPNARVMRLSRQVHQAVIDGRYSSYAAAGAALGLKKSAVTKYRQLLGLADELQQSVLDGSAAGWPLAQLIRVARLDGAQVQQAAFEALLESTAPHQRPGPTGDARSDTTAAEQAPPKPLRVRVVGYFNPERFVEQRRIAVERLQRIRAFVDELNTKLARPRAKRKRDKILGAVDRRLRRDDLLGVFEVKVHMHKIGGRSRHQVELQLDETKWRRRRRYDGFSVLVGHAELTHTAAELCQLYRAKDMVEKDFQVIKSVVELRPIRHRTNLKVKAHVTLCMLALLLERTLRDKLAGKYTVGQALELLERCRLNRYRNEDAPGVYTITELDKEQRSLLRKLRLPQLADDDYLAARITPR